MTTPRNIDGRWVAASTGRAEQLRRTKRGLMHRTPAIPHAEPPRMAYGDRTARAYRDGELLCARVELVVRLDTRLGLAPHERRYLSARFMDRLHPVLRTDLIRLVRRRGAAAAASPTPWTRSNSSSMTPMPSTITSPFACNHRRYATATYATSSSV
jgi:hypothetical protein